ncbi:hypothetical protein [Trichothermofontia sp.]
MRYLVTTDRTHIPTDHQIIMVDGTVPGWEPRSTDRHWDHHRLDGADIQIDEMPHTETSLLETYATDQPPCFVTTQVDADACCAAAWVQLPGSVLQGQVRDRLRAIAWDCDHLMVPDDLQAWAEFAAKAGAALKLSSARLIPSLGLPSDRKLWTLDQWECYTSAAFAQGTEILIAAALGKRPWPGEQGEADRYWDTIAANARYLLQEGRVQFIPTASGDLAICDVRNSAYPIDPRSFYQAVETLRPLNALRPETLLIRDHKMGGKQYTIGSLPHHPGKAQLDFTAGLFERLTIVEQAKESTAEGWGGRRTVGGSGWNTPSCLTPEEIADLLDGPAGSRC